jgi:hypothetical protein
MHVVPRPQNFTPVGGIALFAGAGFGALALAERRWPALRRTAST